MNVVMIGPFGLKTKSTMRERALPMARALAKRGHRVTVIVPPWDNPEDAGKMWLDQQVQVINTPLPKSRGVFFYLTLTGWLVRLALQQNPDVIHLFKPKAYAGLAHTLLYTLKRLGKHTIKLIVDEDDWELAWNDLGNYTPLQKRLFAWQEPWGLTRADAVTVASKNLQYYAETIGVPAQKITYIPNGVRPIKSPANVMKAFSNWQQELAEITAAANVTLEQTIQPPPSYQPAYDYGDSDFEGKIRAQYNLFGKPVILLYTRFFEFKLDGLTAIIKEIADHLPEARWLVVGKGYFGEETQLAETAAAEGFADKLIFAGWVSMEELPYYFAAANVALHPYDDTPINRTKCSVKLLDLLAAGVPVVASKIGQNAEYIQHGRTGYLVHPNDPVIFAKALITILNNRNAQQVLGQEAAGYVNKTFNWNTLVKDIEAAYLGIK